MLFRRLTLLATLLASLAPAIASADTLETPVLGAVNLASAAGWQAWSVPQVDGTHRLQLRAPNGTVTTPAIAAFRAPVDPSIGSIRTTYDLLVVYSRCAGSSTVHGCDVFQLSTKTGKEQRVGRAATRSYSEVAPSLTAGTLAFVRRDGDRNGVYAIGGRAFDQRLQRIVPTVATETATNGTRVGYIAVSAGKASVVVRRISGEGRPLKLARQIAGVPTSIQMTRYSAAFLLPRPGAATEIFQTSRFAGSGGPYVLQVTKSARTLPPGVTSASGVPFEQYLAPDGVTRLDPPAF